MEGGGGASSPAAAPEAAAAFCGVGATEVGGEVPGSVGSGRRVGERIRMPRNGRDEIRRKERPGCDCR